VIWFFRDPSNKCEWKYHDRYTTNGVADLESKLRTTMLSLIGASANCTGAVVPSTTKASKTVDSKTTSTVAAAKSTQPASDSRCPIVIDVRTKSEWDEGHASCAHRLEIQDDPSLVDKVSTLANGDLSYPVYVYCKSGTRSGSAMKVLQDKKWTSVSGPGGWATEADAIEKLCDCKDARETGAVVPSTTTASKTVDSKTTSTVALPKFTDETARDAMSGWMILSVCMLTLNQIFV